MKHQSLEERVKELQAEMARDRQEQETAMAALGESHAQAQQRLQQQALAAILRMLGKQGSPLHPDFPQDDKAFGENS